MSQHCCQSFPPIDGAERTVGYDMHAHVGIRLSQTTNQVMESRMIYRISVVTAHEHYVISLTCTYGCVYVTVLDYHVREIFRPRTLWAGYGATG